MPGGGAGREGVGGRVAGVRDPEARDSVGSGPRASGFLLASATLIFLFQLHVHRMLWALGEINKGLVHVPAMWGGIWEAHSLRTQAPQLSSLGWTSTSRRK